MLVCSAVVAVVALGLACVPVGAAPSPSPGRSAVHVYVVRRKLGSVIRAGVVAHSALLVLDAGGDWWLVEYMDDGVVYLHWMEDLVAKQDVHAAGRQGAQALLGKWVGKAGAKDTWLGKAGAKAGAKALDWMRKQGEKHGVGAFVRSSEVTMGGHTWEKQPAGTPIALGSHTVRGVQQIMERATAEHGYHIRNWNCHMAQEATRRALGLRVDDEYTLNSEL